MRFGLALILTAAFVGTSDAAPTRNIVETAVEAGSFQTLVAAVKAADLQGALGGKGPFTVFAPTDAAFGKLPRGTVQTLLKRSQRAKLQGILKLHVVPGSFGASALLARRTLPTLNGQSLQIDSRDGRLRVNGSTIRTVNIQCSNGVIHVIDGVLLPLEEDIVQVAANAGSFKTLVAALQAEGLAGVLKGKGPFTVFAPTDAAFAKLPRGTVQSLLRKENRAQLQALLKYHVIAARVDASTAVRAKRAKTVQGKDVEITYDGALRVNGARITATDITASNGLIHVIDTVLLPPSPQQEAAGSVLALLESAIDRGAPLFNAGNIDACVAVYAVTAEALIGLGGDMVVPGERAALRKALASKSTAREKAWEFRRGFDEIYERLDRKKRAPPEPKPKTTGKAEFKPRMEAPLPVGFPQPGPVGRVVIKKYPAYRAARAKGGSNGAFWKLFGHIKKNDIAMTAPVEMTMDERGEAMVQADMAFLYERPSQGSTGADGAVDVIDRMGIEVLSIGIRGPMTERKVKDARAAIQQRLRDVGWKAGGKWRLLGYNSPMVPASQRFWELQLPILPGSDS